MRETITIQIGQCGNQIGRQFWTTLLKEHENTPDEDSSLSAFFRFSTQRNGRNIMKARALLIDMDSGPLEETMKSSLGSLFDETQFIKDVSGSGNNFGHGNKEWGPIYRSNIEEGLRKNAELCDSLQSFVLTHSLGGGTGSGLGTYVLAMLEDLYPEVFRFTVSVFPSEENDDVITSPYNSILATKELIDHAHCVMPIDNHSLQLFAKLESEQKLKSTQKNNTRIPQPSESTSTKRERERGFNEMNNVAARMICNLTASCRFHGDMNVDLNEICTNLVPYPRMHFLMTSLSPYRALSSSTPTPSALSFGTNSNNRSNTSLPIVPKIMIQRAFTDLLSSHGQISATVPTGDGKTTIASAFLIRGKVPLADFLKCVSTAQRSLHFPSWNPDACKIGMCSTPHPGEIFSALGVFNSTAFGTVLSRERRKFNSLFRCKAMLHHYTEFIQESEIAQAEETVASVIDDYIQIDSGRWRCNRELENNEILKKQLFPDF